MSDEELNPDPTWTAPTWDERAKEQYRADRLHDQLSKRTPHAKSAPRPSAVVRRDALPDAFVDEVVNARDNAVNEVFERWKPRLEGLSDVAIAEALDRVNAPTQMIELLREARLNGGTRLDTPIDSPLVGRFPSLEIRVLPEKGVSLLLPWLDGVRVRGDGNAVDLRQVLTGGKDLAYLATWAAARDYGPPEPGAIPGLFEWDERDVLERYFGQKKYAANGTRSVPSNVVKALKRDFESLKNLHVMGVENIDAKWPEPFVQTYTDRRGRHAPIYRHAPLIVDLMYTRGRAHYTQFPFAILQLDARDASIAMGLAVLVRRRAIAMLNAGASYEASITEWCAAAGIDAKAGVRKDGHDFWPRTAARLTRIADEATIGALAFVGAGADTIGTLRGNASLLAGYQELRRQQDAAVEQRKPLTPAFKAPRRLRGHGEGA